MDSKEIQNMYVNSLKNSSVFFTASNLPNTPSLTMLNLIQFMKDDDAPQLKNLAESFAGAIITF
jgi:hypothetical protein